MADNRKPLIAGNWKMNGSTGDVDGLATVLAARASNSSPAFEMLICPPAPLLGPIMRVIGESALKLGAQDCHGSESGAHTGDVSAVLLAQMGCEYVIVGHSERRTDHGESSELVHEKAKTAQAAGLAPIVCVGETEAQRDAGGAVDVVREQIERSVPGGSSAATVVVAYEPVWAIGTGRTPTTDDVQEIHDAARAALAAKLGREPAEGVRILYGGSVKPGNAAGLLALPDVDGALVGGASLKADDFWAIGRAAG